MEKLMKSVAALMLMTVVICAAGCKKEGYGVLNGHEYVDLGLPSGLRWATCNVGADMPEGLGYYIAWGETQPKDNYGWGSYQLGIDYNKLTKYCGKPEYGYNGFSDDLTTLVPEDDAATANWGIGWRIPTQEEWQELIDHTTHAWIRQNGVDGIMFTASNGNSIFLPAGGFFHYGDVMFRGRYGAYWSSSLDSDEPYYGKLCEFESNYARTSKYGRLYGMLVRAVCSAN